MQLTDGILLTTNSTYQPRRPLPPPLKGRDPGSFAQHSVIVRMPGIARRVLAENRFPAHIAAQLQALIREIPESPIRPLSDSASPDTVAWLSYVKAYAGLNWLDIPWFFAETYFYRRILEATGYFQPGETHGVDPYRRQKQLGLETSWATVRALAARQSAWLEDDSDRETAVADLVAISLWGNRADLSLWPADQAKHQAEERLVAARRHVIADDTEAVTRHAAAACPTARFDILADNAGFELVCDLCLADYLLSSHTAATVRFHLKTHPTFVSDAITTDVEQTVATLSAAKDSQVQALGGRLQTHLASGRLQLRPHPFWTSPLSLWEMPPSLRQELSRSYLIISKGDANYRRLLGDRHWPYTTPFADILCYTPAPLVALRTLKSEVAAGLTPDKISWLDTQDPDWLTDGRWGVVQFQALPGPE